MTYAMVVVVEAPDIDTAHGMVANTAWPSVQFVGNPWEVLPDRICPTCGAQGEGQSCVEGGKLIDDHADRGDGEAVWDTLECVDQHPDK